MTALLRDALKPNLVQTLEGTPAFVHGGPFANIAHGCNSITATRMALKLGDYTVTEAGFGADLGAEKFLDIKCRLAGLIPAAVVIVATIRALKMHGGMPKSELGREDLEALKRGLPNLLRHVSNIKNVYRLPLVVALNRFPTDTAAETALVLDQCRALGVNAVLSDVWAKGGAGGTELAKEVVRLCEMPGDFAFSYPLDCPIEEKIEMIVRRIYGRASRKKANRLAHRARLRESARLHCQNAVQLFGRSHACRRARKIHSQRKECENFRGRGLHCSPDRRHYDHAGTPPHSRGRKNRRRCKRKNFWLVLTKRRYHSLPTATVRQKNFLPHCLFRYIYGCFSNSLFIRISADRVYPVQRAKAYRTHIRR